MNKNNKTSRNDVWDYINTPFKKRSVWNTFYKDPNSLPFGHWKIWREYVELNYPIQNFVRNVVWPKIEHRWNDIKDINHYLKNRFIKKTHIIYLPNVGKWNDTDTKIENALEILFLDFYRNEYLDGPVDWSAEKENALIIEEIHYFFTVSKPEILKQIDVLMSELYGHQSFDDLCDIFENPNKIDPKKEEKRKLLTKLEESYEKQYTDVLVKLIKNRRILWT